MFTKLCVAYLAQLSKITRFAKCEAVIVEGIKIQHLQSCFRNGFFGFLPERLVAEHRTDFILGCPLVAASHAYERICRIAEIYRLHVYLRYVEGEKSVTVKRVSFRGRENGGIELAGAQCAKEILFEFLDVADALNLKSFA